MHVGLASGAELGIVYNSIIALSEKGIRFSVGVKYESFSIESIPVTCEATMLGHQNKSGK